MLEASGTRATFTYCHLLHTGCVHRGYNIGVRLVEDYLARMPSQQRCHDMRETAQAISKVPVWMYYALIEMCIECGSCMCTQ